MEELIVRPSMKFIRLGYVVVILLIIAAAVAQNQFKDSLPPSLPQWAIPAAFALLLIWPITRHWEQRFTKMTMIGDKLRYETGMFSRATRTIQLSKVQDVTVRTVERNARISLWLVVLSAALMVITAACVGFSVWTTLSEMPS